MTVRSALVFLCVASMTTAPGLASQPDKYAGKMIPNPLLFATVVGEDPGLPPVSCGGFNWWLPLLQVAAGPGETFVMDLAIAPFRTSPTNVVLAEQAGSGIVALRFEDGSVGGLPYVKSAWNDVRVELRPATQDYVLTVNGASAGPLPFESSCAEHGGCFAIGAFGVSSVAFPDESDIAWIDSLTVDRVTAAGIERFLDIDFNMCLPVHANVGGLIVTTPSPRLRRN